MRKTPGASALQKVVKKGSQTAIALAVGISPSTVSRYVAGTQSPQQAIREAFERLYKIPASSWETEKERSIRERAQQEPVDATPAEAPAAVEEAS